MGGGVCWSGCELCGKGWIGKIFWRGFYSQEELMGMHLLLDVIAHCHFLQEEMGLFGEDDEGFVVAMTLPWLCPGEPLVGPVRVDRCAHRLPVVYCD